MPSPGHPGAPVVELSDELLEVVVPEDEDVLEEVPDSASEVVVLDESRFVVTPAVTTAPELLDPVLASPLSVTCGGEEKQPTKPTHSHTQRFPRILVVSHSARRKKPPAPRHKRRRRGPR